MRRVLAWTREEFERRGVGSPRLDAEVLLGHALGLTRMQIYLDLERPLLPAELGDYRALVRRRAAREPVSHITGVREFWSRPFTVTADTLAPRPETELLVERALAWHAQLKRQTPAVLDVGTGTGCLAVTLALEIESAKVTAVDISPEALAVARTNAAALAADVTLLCSNMLEALPADAQYDLMVCNPPYLTVGEWEAADPEVRVHEPKVALVGADDDGLGHHRLLAAQGWPRVAPGGVLLAELGAGQGPAAVRLWEAVTTENGRVSLLKDLAGLDRAVEVWRQD